MACLKTQKYINLSSKDCNSTVCAGEVNGNSGEENMGMNEKDKTVLELRPVPSDPVPILTTQGLSLTLDSALTCFFAGISERLVRAVPS